MLHFRYATVKSTADVLKMKKIANNIIIAKTVRVIDAMIHRMEYTSANN